MFGDVKCVKIQVPINPYGKAKKMAEDIILDFSKTSDMAVMILRLLLLSQPYPEVIFT